MATLALTSFDFYEGLKCDCFLKLFAINRKMNENVFFLNNQYIINMNFVHFQIKNLGHKFYVIVNGVGNLPDYVLYKIQFKKELL